MPNWCYNSLTIQGEKDVIRQIKDGFTSENCFEAVIGKDEILFRINERHHNVNRYGTKWDVHYSDVSMYLEDIEDNQFELTLSFSTAWSPPISFVKIMCAMYKVYAIIKYVERDSDFAGESIYGPNGILLEDEYDGLEGEYRLFPEGFFGDIEDTVFLDAYESGLTVDDLVEDRLGFMSDQDKAYVRSDYEEYLLSQTQDT